MCLSVAPPKFIKVLWGGEYDLKSRGEGLGGGKRGPHAKEEGYFQECLAHCGRVLRPSQKNPHIDDASSTTAFCYVGSHKRSEVREDLGIRKKVLLC